MSRIFILIITENEKYSFNIEDDKKSVDNAIDLFYDYAEDPELDFTLGNAQLALQTIVKHFSLKFG